MGRCTLTSHILIFALLVSTVISARIKRHLVFNKGTKFFIRVNVRENLFKYTTVFAHAAGFRLNFELPDKALHHGKQKRLHRRDVYQGLEQLLDLNDINGRSCIVKFLCEASVLESRDDFVTGLYKLILTPKQEDKEIGYDAKETDCQTIAEECPLSIVHFIHADFECQSGSW